MAGCLLADDPAPWDLYEQGRAAEKAGHMSQAYLLYSQAAALDPKNKTYWLRSQRSEEHTSELQSLRHLVCRLLLEKKTNIDQGWNAIEGVNRDLGLGAMHLH